MGVVAAAAAEVFTSTEVIAAATAATVGAVADKALAPDAPELPSPAVMPDPLEQQKAKQRSLTEQMARRGRAGSILTNSGNGTLGGG